MHNDKEELCKDMTCYVNQSWLAVNRLAENYERSMINKNPHKARQVKKPTHKKPNHGKTLKHPHMKGFF